MLRRLTAARGSVLLGRLKAPTQHSTHIFCARETAYAVSRAQKNVNLPICVMCHKI